jgi:hypothetical protein
LQTSRNALTTTHKQFPYVPFQVSPNSDLQTGDAAYKYEEAWDSTFQVLTITQRIVRDGPPSNAPDYMASLPAAQVITVDIPAGVTSASGDTLAQGVNFSFTTEAGPDVTPPAVVSISPDDNVVREYQPYFVVTFSEPVQEFTSTAFTITNTLDIPPPYGSGVTVTDETNGATVTFSPDHKQAIINQQFHIGQNTLSIHGTGDANVTTGEVFVQDVAGNPIDLGVSASFVLTYQAL